MSEVDPFIRLDALKVYMNRWINEWPRSKCRSYYTDYFGDFFNKKYGHHIPGTLENAKFIATHCYYCDIKLIDGRTNDADPRRSSVDHYYPKSRGKTEKFVICCADCNTKKANVPPKELTSMIFRATMRGYSVWGFHTKKLEKILTQIQKVNTDMLHNTGPKIYYIKK